MASTLANKLYQLLNNKFFDEYFLIHLTSTSLLKKMGEKSLNTFSLYAQANKNSDPLIEQLFSLWFACSSVEPRYEYKQLARPIKIADDLLQPLWGLIHLLTAVCYWVAAPFRLLYAIVSMDKEGIEETLTWFVHGLQNAIWGTLELATTPLAYLYRMPLRGLLTLAGADKQSKALTLGATLFVFFGMTAALWAGCTQLLPSVSNTVQAAVIDAIGQQALQTIAYSTLGLTALGALLCAAAIALSCSKANEVGIM